MINNRQNGRRRGRGGQQVRGGPGNPERNNRIDNRSRGNAAQLLEKYKNLARDMQTQGDRVMTEYYLQFADHYFRVLGESRQRFEDQNQQNQQRRPRDDYDFDDGDDGDMIDEPRREEPRRDDRRPPRAEQPTDDEPTTAPVAAREEEPRSRAQRRPRRESAENEGPAPRIDIDRLPPAFASEGEPATADEQQLGGEEAAAEEAPVRRRRVRRPKTEEGDDSSVAA